MADGEADTPTSKEPSDEELREAAIVEAARYRARLDDMSYIELIGSILARAQVIEEAMRMLIVGASDEYGHPREIKGTFGQVLNRFRRLYPEEHDLIELLELAREARNDAAHTALLVAHFIEGQLPDQDPDSVRSFQRRAMRKTVEGMDWALREILRFLRGHPVEIPDWPPADDAWR